jgi:hypothetical protein
VLTLLVPPNFGGASEKCQGEFYNFVTPWRKKYEIIFLDMNLMFFFRI